MNTYKTLWLLSLILFVLPSQAFVVPMENNISKQASVSIKNAQYLVEEGEELALEQVLELNGSAWQETTSFPLNLGILERGAWVKFELVNVEPEQVERILEVANPRLHHLDIYMLARDQLISSFSLGSSQKFLDRPVISRNFAIPLTLGGMQSTTVFLRAESSLGVFVPLYLHQEKVFWQLAIAENIGQGLYFGILLMFVIFNLGLYLFRNAVLHLILAVDLSVFALVYANHLGLNFQYFWPLDPQFNYLASMFFSYLVLLTANVFTWNFVNLNADNLRSGRKEPAHIFATRLLYYGFNVFSIVGFVLLWFVPIEWSSYFCAALVLIDAYYLIYVTYLSFKKGDSYSSYYLFTYCLAAITASVYVLHKLALLPSNEIVLNALGYSMLLQALVLTSVLLGRNNLNKRVLGFYQKTDLIPYSVKDWIAQFSHEIRTPLNGIVGMADLLKDTPLNPTQYSYVRNLSSSGEHLVELVSDIIDHDSLMNNQMRLEKVDFNLIEVCQQTIGAFGRTSLENNVEIDLKIEPGMPLSFHADRKRLRQLLINLIHNSLKTTQNGRVELRLSYSSDNVLCMQVWDNGVGMTKQQQADVFRRFRESGDANPQRFGNKGLGLAIAEKLAVLMSGTLTVESTLNEYCCFTLMLPISIAKQEKILKETASVLFEPEVHKSNDASTGAVLFPRHLKILGVDDNDINRRVLKAMLNKLGHTVVEACNGQEAIDIVQSGIDIDLIIMDCEMPVMNGFVATQKIRQWQYGQADKHCQIIALTAHALEEHKEKCLEAGMDGHLSKPLHFKKLRELIDQLAS